MAWQPPEDELDSNVLQQWKPPEDELDENISNQWSPPEDELDNSPKKIKDVGTLNQMKASGQELTREQERILWDADERKPLTQKASEAITSFFPAAIDIAKQAGAGTAEFVYDVILNPLDTMSQSPEEAAKTLNKAKNTLRSFAVGASRDIQETADAAVRFGMFGSAITDKLLGRTDDERFERYMLRESMRQFSQKVYEDNPDHAARLLAENPILQKMAYAAALAQGGTPEEAELAKKAYSELVLESGLTKDEINENVATLAEIMSPIALPGTNRITNAFGKATGKVTQKAGELALKGVVAPVARGVAKAAGKVEAGAEQVQQLSRKIGEFAVGDPDTLVKNAANTAMMPIRIPAKTTGGIAKTIADVAGEAGYGRRGMFERAGRKADAGELTKRLFGPETLGGKGRARMADWAVRQTNAIVQPAINGSVLNIVMGLPDIESGADLGFMAGTGAGIGAFGGSRFQDRAMALVDPTTSLAQKIDAIVTPDPAAYRKDQDADIKRFLATADTSLLDSINDLSSIDNIKSALDVKIKNLEGKKIAQIRDEDAQRIQENIDLLSKQREELDKTTPQTEAEIKRQIQLSFADAMDLAKTTGAAAGLNNIEVKVLKPEQMEDFYRERYGKNLIDAEAVRRELIGNPTLSPSEQELLTKADETILRFLSDLAGASNARGFAVAERPDMPGQKGATIVINGDLVTQMGRDGLNISRVINHEMQHALANFEEVRQMLAPLRKELFDQKIQNPDGSFEVVSKGTIPDAQLDAYALQYAAGMDASGGTSFLSHFADQNQVREYMKEEVLSELAGLSGASHGDIRAGLDSVGRQAVDWLETKTRSGALKRIKEGLRQFGVLVDDQGQFTSVLGANLSPEALAMMRQYQRKLRDLNESLVYNSDPRKDEPAIPITELATNRAFQQRYKDSEFFEQEQVISMQAPDGSKQEIPVPVNAELNPLVGSYTFADGQLVDDAGNVVSFGPDVALQAMPDGTVVTLDTRVARNPNGSPRILSPRETKRRAKERGDAIREVIDNAPDDGSGVRLEDTGNGNYRGTLSPTQIAAINALPNDVVAPSLKRKIAFFNDILGRKDGTIVEIEYQAALRDGKYRALKPQLRTEIPIGFQFDKQGNFLMTTMSVSRMYDKANAWAAKSPRNLRLWGGDMTKFWDSVRQYTLNHQKGVQGHIGLHSDPYIAMRMKNRINDLFNVYRKETREANPERTTLPKRRGQDSRDVIIRSRRMDRVNSYDETALAKMPFQYESAVQNYLPAENPLADFQSAEQFAQATEVDQNLVNRAIAGDIQPLEVELSNEDVLRPMEYVDVSDNKIRIRSMFDPTQGFLLEPQESAPEMPAVQFMPAVAVVPERFTGKPEDERRGRYVAPPSFFQKFDIGEYERGGKFFDLETGEEITDKIYQTGTIDVSGKSPKLVSEQSAEDLEDGKTYKTNLFKKSAGWEWISENPPEVASIGKNPVLISVEGGKEHKYALKVDFTNGVQLKRYADKPSEPRLRPTGKGDLNLGNVVGEIDIRGKQHPVYDSITIGTQFMPAVTEVETSFSDLSKEPVTTITETDGISRTLPFDPTGRMDEFSDRPETEPQQSADSTSSVDAGKITPAEKAFDNIKYAPARAWGVQSLADRFDRFRVSIGNEAIQPPIYRKDFAKHETEFRQAAQIAEQIYRSTLSNVDAAYASNPGTADRLLPRLPEVQSLFTDSDGRVKFLNSTPINITRGDILFMPAEIDARYTNLEAKAKAGDKEAETEAQRMVDEASKAAGYDIGPVFHGTTKQFNEFKEVSDFNRLNGFYFGTKKDAQFFAKSPEGIIIPAYLSIKNPASISDMEEAEKTVSFYSVNRGNEVKKNLIKQGFDGAVLYFKDSKETEYVAFNPEQIKSADPFTYDDAGNLIPLSERFQSSSPDIRFMPPEAEGATPEPEGLQGIEAPQIYKRIGPMIPPLQEMEPPVRGQVEERSLSGFDFSSQEPVRIPEISKIEEIEESDVPELPKKYAFAYTTSSDRIPLVDALVKAKNWQAIRDLNQATIRHAMSDLPNVKYTMKDLVGAFENEREISVMPEFEINNPEELAEVRKRMVSLGELWQQTEVLEEQVGGGDQNLLGTVDNDGYLHIGKATLTFDKLTPALVEKARQASGIQAMSYDNNSVIFYDTDNNETEFGRRIREFRDFITKNGRVLENFSGNSTRVRSYRNPNSPKEGSLYYNEDPVRLFGEGQLPDRLRSPVYRVVSELLGRPLPPPKDGRASYFVKEDVTPKQVKLQNEIANKQAAVVLNDKKNKDVIKAYEELNAELLKQFDALVAAGMTFNAAPDYDAYSSLYPDSASVIRDIRNNNNLVYLKTTPETFGPIQNGKRMDFSFHPILKDSGRTDASGNKMSYNDILRVVHDAIAHGIYSAQFGPVGEESAWNTHIRTIDNPWARWALTMETRAQNSWVNYQDKFLTEKKTGEDRMPLKKGEKGFIPVSSRDYAEQKFALIPLKYALTGDAKVDKPVKDLMEEIGEKRSEGSPEKDPEWMPSKKERERIYASIKQPQGTPKDLLKQASDVIGKLTRKDNAENVPVIVEKAWAEKKSKDEDAEDGTDDGVEDGEVITTSTAVLKDVVVYSLRGTPIVVRPLPNLLAENVKTKVSKNVLSIAKDKDKYLQYSNRVLTAADKLRQDPEMFITPSGYLQFMREAGASGNLLMPPSQIAQLVKDPNAILQLWQGGYHGKKTAPGTVAAAVAGLDSVNAMRDLFIQDGVNLGPTRMITALHHLWGILSRQLDPYNQEALWMRMVSYAPVMEQIQLSIDGKFKLTENEWKQVVQDSRKATKGDYQKAGNNATANANAFHHMLSKHNGKWQELANIYKLSDPVEMTNAFWGLNVGATGIKNKVQRFIGLTFGIHGSVLDRWRFVGLNLPTAMGLTGKATPETYFNYYGRNKTIPEDPVGIYKSYGTVENGNPVFSTALYAGIDRAIQGVIDNSKEMRDFLGVHATPGGFHWVDWNCVKNEAVGHSSLDLTKEFLKRKGRNGTVEDFLDVVRTSTTYTRADQDGKIIDLVMKDGIFQVVEQK